MAYAKPFKAKEHFTNIIIIKYKADEMMKVKFINRTNKNLIN